MRPTEDFSYSKLAEIDWNFTGRSGDALESIHPYPAKFIAEIPQTLIRELMPPPGTAVLDPFCGSGATLIAAQRAGLRSIGVDLNPIACMISRVKTAPLPESLQRACAEVVLNAKDARNTAIPEIPNLDHWFKPEIQQVVAALVSAIDEEIDENRRDAMRLSLSSILVRISNQESDTRYAAIEKNITMDDVFSNFMAACAKTEKALQSRAYSLVDSTIIKSDLLALTPDAMPWPVGLVITSPPYPNAYEYWLYHKYRMWWLGFDPLAVKDKEIGARAHFFKKNHHTAEHFRDQMAQTFALLEAVLVKGGYVCFVVGRSIIHGQVIDNAQIVAEVAQEKGLEEIDRFERVISPTRKSFNLSHANIKTETLLVFRK